MNYEEMTWLEINHKIAEILEPNATQIQESRFNISDSDNSVEVYVDDYMIEYDFSKPNDSLPIIFKNRIALKPKLIAKKEYATPSDYIDGWEAKKHSTWFEDEDPTRAAMICFLMMKDAEK